MFLNAQNSCEGLSESRWMINIFIYSLKSGPTELIYITFYVNPQFFYQNIERLSSSL